MSETIATESIRAMPPVFSAPPASPQHAASIAAEWRDRIAGATATGAPLRIRGGGTKDWYGQTLQGDTLDTRAYAGIVSYDPAELVITARCGTGLADIEAALTNHGQLLPFEPPHFGADATLGGCIAAGLAGPRRATAGAPRDFVLGASLMDGRGKILHFGGQVMKNVAGYDVARLMAGSLGTLGLMLDLSIKVLPRPVAECTLHFAMNEADALLQLDAWAGQPLPLAGSAWHAGVLAVRLAGAAAAVQTARERLGGERVDGAEADAFWRSLREQHHPFFLGRATHHDLWRLSLPAATPPLTESTGDALIEWGGTQRWYRAAPGSGQALRDAAQRAGGHATLFRRFSRAETNTVDSADSIFTPLPGVLMKIHRGLKHAFDPAHIFNRGRMYPDF